MKFASGFWKSRRLKRVRRLIASGQFTEAEALLSSCVTRWPADVDVRALHALCAHDSGSFAEALLRWNRIREGWPDHAFAWSGSAANARELNRLIEAQAIIDEALRRFPTDRIALTEAIRIYDRLADSERSLQLSGELTRLEPSHAGWRRAYFERLLSASRFDDARLVMEEAPTSLADADDLAFCRARIALRGGDWSTADRLLEACVSTGGADECRLAEMRQVAHDLKLHHPEESRLIWAHLVRLLPIRVGDRHHYADALIRCGRIREADDVVRAALDVDPDDFDLQFDSAVISMKNERWSEAITGLEALIRRRPDHDEARLSLSRAWMEKAQADLESGTSLPFAAERQDVGLVEDEEARALLLGFESIGQDCEFGLVQRRFGAEPLGLFRWNSTTPDRLRQAFEASLEGLGDPACTLMSLWADYEYYLSDKRWGFAFHTWISRHEVDRDDLYRKMCRRMAYLRNKMLADLAVGDKILVLKTFDADVGAVRDLLASLSLHGPARLLWVRSLAGDPVLAASMKDGSVVELEPGLMMACLPSFGNRQDGPWQIAFEQWLAVCRQAAEVGKATLPEYLSAV